MAQRVNINSSTASIRQAADALRTLQSLTNADIERVASLSTKHSLSTEHRYDEPAPTIREELSSRFPTLRSHRTIVNRSRNSSILNSSSNSSKRKRSSSTPVASTLKRGRAGRPVTKHVVYKDLVIIPHPQTARIPTHSSRVELEKRGLVISEFPFDRAWDAATLAQKIVEQLPRPDIQFEFVKVRYTILGTKEV